MKHTLYLLCLLLCACGPTNKLRRAEKLIAAAELQGAYWKRDTVKMEVPVYIRRVDLDTLFLPTPGDTVTLREDKLVIKYVKLPGDSVYIKGVCEADTVYQTVTHTVTNTIHTKRWPWWYLLVAAAVGAVVMLVWRNK